jgi:heme-degrading monooxygenase HmoA
MLISVTRLRIRSLRYLPEFFFYTFRSVRQVKRAPGNLGLRLLRDADRTFWTLTAWQDEAAMRAFMFASPHREAMPKLANWCDEAAVAHWTQDTAQMPSWEEAHMRMQQQGRPSKVNHPTRAHETFEIRKPVAP